MISIQNFLRQLTVLTVGPLYIFFCSPIVFFLSRWNKKFAQYANVIWSFSLFFFVKLLFIRDIQVHYDPKILKYSKSIFISNHVNNLDWFIIWISLTSMKKNKIIFNTKRSMFFYGKFIEKICGKKTDFIFLNRHLDYDYITLVDACKKMRKMDEFITVLFPEGTLISHKHSKLISNRRSKSRNTKATENVMIPKTSGFKILRDELKHDLNGIINCTLRYSPNFNSLWKFLSGKRTTVQVYIDTIDIDEIPTEDSAVENWLIDLFHEKDQFLATPPLPNSSISRKLKIRITYSQTIKTLFSISVPWVYTKVLSREN